MRSSKPSMAIVISLSTTLVTMPASADTGVSPNQTSVQILISNFKSMMGMEVKTAKSDSIVISRLSLFIDEKCDTCDALFAKAKAQLEYEHVLGLDLVFPASYSIADMSKWAIQQGVSPTDVTSELVTLNRYSPAWEQSLDSRALPILLMSANGHAVP